MLVKLFFLLLLLEHFCAESFCVLHVMYMFRSVVAGNAGLCRQITQSSQLRDVEWTTHSCTLSFNSIGIWPEGADGTDVNNCDRSHEGNLMATADDFGKVKLYSYPVTQPRVSTSVVPDGFQATSQ